MTFIDGGTGRGQVVGMKATTDAFVSVKKGHGSLTTTGKGRFYVTRGRFHGHGGIMFGGSGGQEIKTLGGIRH